MAHEPRHGAKSYFLTVNETHETNNQVSEKLGSYSKAVRVRATGSPRAATVVSQWGCLA